jgi:VWFA-related protein
MTKFLTVFGMALLFAAGAIAQSPRPAPNSTPPVDDDVVKISTNLIQIDVTVTDGKGKPITDLKPEEVEIYENGEKQKITNFSFISSVRTTTEKPSVGGKISVPVPQQVLRPDQIHRTIALVVDDLSLSFESAFLTRKALKKFVDEQMQEGDLVAIIRTGAGIGALQQFTSDKRMLYAAIEKVKWNPSGTGGVSAFAPVEAAADTSLQTDPSATPDPDAVPDLNPASSARSLQEFRNTVFSTGTLGALKYVVTGMGQLPGRKSVILFSDGFKLFETDENGIPVSNLVLEFLRELVDVANRSSVVFYTVDARGLANTALTAEDNVSDTSPDAMNNVTQGRSDQLLDTQEGLSYLAEETGGFAVLNNNDISKGVRRVLEDQSYYLVGYEPEAATFDPAKRKYNSLTVKVLRKGANVRYRSGFFNVADKPAGVVPTAASPQTQLETALVSPFAVSGIDLRLNALFGSDAKTGAFVRSLLHINAGDLKFTDEKDGTKKAVFEVLAMSFGDNGDIVDQLEKSYTLSLKGEAYKKVLDDGFVYQFAFPVKKAGAYQYRVAIRDAQGGKIGSASQFIEVPNLSKKHLATSSLVIENLTAEQWRKMGEAAGVHPPTNAMSDTALRRVRIGTVLRYGLEIYNARLDTSKVPKLTTRVRVFRDGKLVLDGKETPVDLQGQTDTQHIKAAGALAIGNKLLPGDYILQIIVTDQLASAKQQVAAQFVQFEVVE